MLFHRPIQTRLSLITPSVSATVGNTQADQKSYHDYRSKERQFEVNPSVLVEDHSGNSKWMPGIILSQLGPMNYEVLVNNKVFKRYVDQILKNTESTSKEAIDVEQAKTNDSFNFPSSSNEHHPSPDTDTSNASYPSRDRRPPNRLSYI